ncbi:MAG: YbaB/EbfC family nucleoid-associated protein [Oscillospiraceae bacterium]|nr:YbaB/EbfC family nucleoid-associated protein [Oscillospiraceae bacterium]
MAKGYRGGGFGGMGGMGGGMRQTDLMKQAQKMQADMLKMQEELENRVYSATSGGGMVTAEVSGKRELVKLSIDPEAVDPEDVEMLQDLIVAAVNTALRDAEKASSDSMARLTGGLNLGF